MNLKTIRSDLLIIILHTRNCLAINTGVYFGLLGYLFYLLNRDSFLTVTKGDVVTEVCLWSWSTVFASIYSKNKVENNGNYN